MFHTFRLSGLRQPSLAHARRVEARVAGRISVPSTPISGCLNNAYAALKLPQFRLPRPMTTQVFQGSNLHELKQWLESVGICTSKYGKGTSRGVDDLLDEVQKKESVLVVDQGQALRMVNVLSLHITNAMGQVLYEDRQVLPDGRVRCRNVRLSEKLVGSETWRNAIQRAVSEELGCILPGEPKVEVFEDTYKIETEVADSMSYPGLKTKYVFHRVAVTIEGLPEHNFTTSEPRPNGTLFTHWTWRSDQPVKGVPSRA